MLEFDFELTPFFPSNELLEYKEDLITAASAQSDVMFSNSSVEHAALVLSTIFNEAKKEVNIYGGMLRTQLSSLSVYADSLRECIERNVTVNVLLSGDAETFSPMARWLVNLNRENVHVYHNPTANRFISNSLIEEESGGNNCPNYHFTIADGRMYRLEYNISEFKANASFNFPPMVEKLEAAFDAAVTFAAKS